MLTNIMLLPPSLLLLLLVLSFAGCCRSCEPPRGICC
jgi:hypothetical protein